MAAFVFTNGYVTINAVDSSDHVRQVSIEFDTDTPETTAMSSTAVRTYLPGLIGARCTIELNDDAADNNIDERLFDIWAARAAVAIAVKPVNAAISTSNPEYQFSAILQSLGTGGGVGDRASKASQWVITGAVTRDVTP